MDSVIIQKLDALVGKTIHYQKQNIEVKKYKEIAGNICIVTSARTFQFYPKEIEEKFLELISEAKEVGTFEATSAIEKQNSIALPSENNTIKEFLLDALKKVKEDPDYLAQAKGICEITNTLVNVQKTEIEMIKLQKDL